MINVRFLQAKNSIISSLTKHITSTFLTQFPVLILTFASGVIITRLIGAEGKGIYAIFTANTQLLALFLSVSANSGLTYYLSNKFISERKIIGLSIITLLFASVVGVLAIFIPFNLDSLLFPNNFNTFSFKCYLFLCFFFTVLNTLFLGIFQGYKFYILLNKISIINAIINVLFFGVFLLDSSITIFGSKLFDVLLITLIIYALNTLINGWFYFKVIKLRPDFNVKFKEEFMTFLRYIGIGHLSNMLNFLNYRMDIWFVNSYQGAEQLGLYSLAVSFSQMLLMLSAPIATVLFPYLVEETDKLKKISLVGLLSRINTLSLIIGAFFMFFTSEFIIPTIYGQEFINSISSFKIMIFATIFMGLTKIFASYLASEDKVSYNLYATIIGFIITFSLNTYLVPKIGIVGASITSLVTYFSIFAFVFYKTLKLNNSMRLNFFIPNLVDYKMLKTIISSGKK